jgi:hypothetical protein
MISEPLAIVARVARVLDDLGVAYLVGGSLASSIHGIPRSTQDADIVADLEEERVDAFVGALAGDFYVDADMIRDAIRRKASFNIVHLKTMLKVDVFAHRRDAWSRAQMGRRMVVDAIQFASAEDVVLHKLIWYELGHGISDRQWGDVVGVLRVQAGRLDEGYLDEWSRALGIDVLLERARVESKK